MTITHVIIVVLIVMVGKHNFVVDYVNIIVEKGKAHNIPVLNLYENLGIDPNNEEDREKYTADGLHFNEEGHEVLADCLIDFLKNL